MGVGQNSTAGDAAVSNALFTWILQDGVASIGRILFTAALSTRFDSDLKMWRFAADIFNDLAVFLEILASHVQVWDPNVALALACSGTIFRSVTGIAGGATKAALSHRFSLKHNTGDISAKDGNQETLVSLFGMALGSYLIATIPDTKEFTAITFAIFTFFHLLANYLAVRNVVLRTWNDQRFRICVRDYLSTSSSTVPTPAQVSAKEWILWLPRFDGPSHIQIGADKIMSSSESLAFQHAKHLVFLEGESRVSRSGLDSQYPKQITVLLHEAASGNDILFAYFHAVLITTLDAPTSLESSLAASESVFPDFLKQASSKGWTAGTSELEIMKSRFTWSSETKKRL